ncbi:unnamed protein product, partial [Soboliphyme baturini]|uniref:EGF-like domain-containing protein n=1 Tax=Soboliphyme baturini TaxID=241478 RepID=A0A183J8U2_9BILA
MDGLRSMCYCDSSYSGNDCTEQDTNECVDKPCHWLAQCSNTFNSYHCTCLPGFKGDGHNCTDINECEADADGKLCPEHSTCCNIPGSYFCNCSDGFRPVGTPLDKCVDINECTEKLHRCKQHETCRNTVGSYLCVSGSRSSCPEGFSEHAGSCIKLSEGGQRKCKTGNDCDRNADCLETAEGFKCTCRSGYIGDGRTCQ